MIIVPGIISVGGVFFLHFGLVSSLTLYNLGLAARVSNGLLPLLKHQRAIYNVRESTHFSRLGVTFAKIVLF